MMKTSLAALALSLACSTPSFAFDLRELKELVPPSQLAKARAEAKKRATALIQQRRPALQQQGKVLQKRLAKKLGVPDGSVTK